MKERWSVVDERQPTRIGASRGKLERDLVVIAAVGAVVVDGGLGLEE